MSLNRTVNLGKFLTPIISNQKHYFDIKPHQWGNGQHARLEWGRLRQTKNYDIGICCFSAKHAALRRKGKDWLARNQDKLSKWSDMSITKTGWLVE